jgi:hydrogenase-4 component B
MTLLWPLALLPPLVALTALLVPGRHRRGAVRTAALAPLLAIPLAVAGPRAGALDLPWLLLGSRLEVDPVGRPLLLVAALLYAVALAGAGPAVPERRPAFAAFLLACWLGNAGVLLAADAATFYLSFAVMGFCAYGLVVHDRTPAALRAGRVYLVLTVLGELCLLSGLLISVGAGGMLLSDAPAAVAGSEWRDLAVVLLVVGFGVKAGLVPLHVWLPLAHPAAPAPASAVLSGCMVKAGLVGLLRFLPLGEAAMPRTGAVVGGLALAAAFLAVAVGLTQRDPKANLAYSTVSQMGFHLVLVGAALASPELAPAAVAAAVVYAVHHGLAKGALFLGVAVHKAYGGSGVRHAVTAGLVLSALAVAGAPFSSGAAAKYSAKEAVGDTALAGVDLVTALPLVAVGTTLLLLRFLWLLPEAAPARVHLGIPGLLGGWAALVLVAAPLTWLLAPRWVPDSPPPSAGLDAVRDATWPVLLALVLAAAWVRLLGTRRVPAVPQGDLVVPAAAAVAASGRVLRAAGGALRIGRVRPALPSPSAVATALERRLVDWRASGGALLALLGALTLAVVLR